MMVKILLLLLILILFPPLSFAHTESFIVKMTSNGFEPQNISLDENSTVIFINEDKVTHWPASNIHPTHDIYPEFDPQKPVEPGSSWPFKPKAGEWKFHDHLFPHFRGSLIVQKETGVNGNVESGQTGFNLLEIIKNFFANFYENFKSSLLRVSPYKTLEPSDFKKLKSDEQMKTLENMIKRNGSQKSWDYFKLAFKGNAGSSGNVHDLAHFLGKLMYEKEGFEGISICSTEFAFGCFHGFLDKAFEKNLDKLSEAEAACGTLGKGGPSASCVHGIGHGIASFYQTADLKAALSSCNRLTFQGLQYCFDGVFMEFERAASSNFYSRENPYKPCDELEQKFGPTYSFACGRNQPTVLMSRFKYTFDEVISICLGSKSNQFKAACFDALGFIITKSTSNATEIIASCKKIGVDEYILRCAKAAAGELIFQEVPGWQTNAPRICKSLPINFREECQYYINELIRQYGREAVSKLGLKEKNEDEDDYIRKQLKICMEMGGRDDCYKEVAALFFNQFGLKGTLTLLEQNENYSEVYARCHEVTHFLSRAEYERLKNVPQVYSQCNSTCHGGCYHGTLEAYLKEKQLEVGESQVSAQFDKICGKLEDYDKPLVFYECMHGLGHAAMYVSDMEIPQSLKLCDAIYDPQNRERCFGGVFMENSSSSTSVDHPGKYVKVDDPYFPCNSLDEKYLKLCYRYQSSYFSILTKQDWKKVADLCLGVPQNYQMECFRTIGTNQVGFTKDLNLMKLNCEQMPTEEFKNICFMGVISSFAYRFVGDASKMINFCSMIDEKFKENCFRQIGSSFSDWSNDKEFAKNECRKISSQDGINWCLSVQRNGVI